MPRIDLEFVNRFSDVQGPIWEIASQVVSTAFNADISLANPLTVGFRTEDVGADLSGAQLAVRWSFKDAPQDEHIIVVSPDLAVQFLNNVVDSQPEAVTPELVAENAERFYSLVHGLIDGMASFRSLQIAGENPAVEYEIFSFPPNLASEEELIRVQIAVSGSGISGGLIWLLSETSARRILGEPLQSETASEEAAQTPRIVSKEERDIELLMDIPLEVTVELGRVSMVVQDILDLGNGSIVELEKVAGEPVDVLVNGRLVARGEVVVVEDNFGVRLSEILSPQDRLGKLGDAA